MPRGVAFRGGLARISFRLEGERGAEGTLRDQIRDVKELNEIAISPAVPFRPALPLPPLSSVVEACSLAMM